MSCSNPLPALDRGFKRNKDGKLVRDIKLLDMRHKYIDYGLDRLKEKFGDSLLLLPCGKCYSCSVSYSRMWASRIMLESQDHQSNCFITLTYADCFKPDKPSKRHFQLFMKRLRKELDVPIRYFACGEIGDGKGDRGINPHYHAIIFGFDFPDKVFLKRSKSGLIIYRSELLEKLWPYGISSIGEVSPESSQYVAKYSMKRKLTGEDHGEFVLMSRKPGIGINGFDPSDYDTDKIYLYGKKFKIPRYFDKLAERHHPFDLWLAKQNRLELARRLTSKKYQFNFVHEEDALEKLEEDKIRQDVMKVRYI